MNKELKRCPFCGGEHIRCRWNYMSDGFRYREIHCNDCSATLTKYSEYIEDDIELCILWNTRVNDPQIIEKAESYKQGDEQESLIINDDTREKLEADICKCINARSWGMNHDYMISCLVEWLDRQAAITKAENEEHECTIVGAWDDYATKLEDERSELREKVDNLTAERNRLQERNDRQDETIDKLKAERNELSYVVDKLRRQVDGMFCLNDLNNKIIKELEAKRDKLINECNELRRVVKTQADSFAKMERELAEARGGLHAKENTGVSR